jgi:multisubunit Na+/H+ antiporter MnhG subunit
MKYLIVDRGFHASTLSFSSMGLVGLFVTVFLIIHTSNNGFSLRLFLYGLFGSITNSLGLAYFANANSLGPSGPV